MSNPHDCLALAERQAQAATGYGILNALSRHLLTTTPLEHRPEARHSAAGSYQTPD